MQGVKSEGMVSKIMARKSFSRSVSRAGKKALKKSKLRKTLGGGRRSRKKLKLIREMSRGGASVGYAARRVRRKK
jgi:hypothetical protein